MGLVQITSRVDGTGGIGENYIKWVGLVEITSRVGGTGGNYLKSGRISGNYIKNGWDW